MLTPKDWPRFQHYTNRNPPWVKLHKTLLDDRDFFCLPDASRALAPMLWLLASEQKDGVIRMSTDELAFRLRRDESYIIDALKPLVQHGFFETDSAVLALSQQHAMPETERETETEKKKDCTTPVADAPAAAPPVKPKKEPKPKVIGVYPVELDMAMETWRDLGRELRSEEILIKFPNDPRAQFVAAVGTKGKAWEAWRKRLGVVTPNGVRITNDHILAAVKMWAENKYAKAKAGKSLSAPNLSTLINSADFEDALLRAVEGTHAN